MTYEDNLFPLYLLDEADEQNVALHLKYSGENQFMLQFLYNPPAIQQNNINAKLLFCDHFSYLRQKHN